MLRLKSIHGNAVLYPMLFASAIFAVFSLVTTTDKTEILTNIALVADTTVVTSGDTFTTNIIVSSDTPVNVFAGTITFDPAISVVEHISYNTSIANLWTTEPWYENGDGTITFAGGTTVPGGFVGSGQLMTITFRSKNIGKQQLLVRDVTILEHDGLGTETDTTANDVFVDVRSSDFSSSNSNQTTGPLEVVITDKTFDLTNDGKISIADVSAFMILLIRNDLRADFNNDGKVSMSDLSMLLAISGSAVPE